MICSFLAIITFAVAPKDRIHQFIVQWLKEEESVKSSMDLPHRTGLLGMEVIPLHPFLKEFQFEVQIKLKDGKTFKKTLEIQSGGPPNLTVIWMEKLQSGPFLGFDHMVGSQRIFEIVDLSSGDLRKYSTLKDAKSGSSLPATHKVYTIGWIRDSVLTLEANSGSTVMQ